MRDWLSQVQQWYLGAPRGSTLFLCFPAYRPELGRNVAARLNVAFFDYRATCMAPLGWKASSLSLDNLEAAVAVEAGTSGVLIQNAEALLALKNDETRRAWLAAAARRQWPNSVVLPLFLFAHELPAQLGHQRFNFAAADLPEEDLLERLATLR